MLQLPQRPPPRSSRGLLVFCALVFAALSGVSIFMNRAGAQKKEESVPPQKSMSNPASTPATEPSFQGKEGDERPCADARPAWGQRFAWPALAVLVVIVASVSALTTWYVVQREPLRASVPLKRFSVDTRATPLSQSVVPVAVSPDGTKLVYTTGSYEGAQLYVRSFDPPAPKPLAGTLSAANSFFSPDGKWVGFSASSGLKKVPITGGPVVALCSCRASAGAVWSLV